MRSAENELPEVTTTFGVSGYLRESDVLIWDRATQTIWQQIGGRGIAGPRAGTKLAMVPIVDTTWAEWKRHHPASPVLRGPKPVRAYAGGYRGYHESERVMFPLEHRSDRLRNKAVVTGVRVADGAACWSHERLAERAGEREEADQQGPLTWHETVGGEELTLTYDPEGDSLSATRPGDGSANESADGAKATPEQLPTLRMYWFAWFTFNPATTVDGDAIGD